MKRAALALAFLSACGAATELPGGGASDACASCHVAQHRGWANSPHAARTPSPVFEAMLPKVKSAWGDLAEARCVACHQPRYGGDAAIGCVACHAAVGNRGEANGALVVDLDAPLAGPHPNVSTPAHATTTRAFLTSPSLCGTCHEVHGPALFDESTLGELRASGSKKSCVDCHSAEDHAFQGVDPLWSVAPAARKDSLGPLLARALTLSVSESAGGCEVTLTNVGADHGVPTGVSFLRDVWVDATVVDATGATFDEPRIIELGAELTRGGTDVALITEADDVQSRSLAPGESRHVALSPPPEATAPVTCRATLRAQAIRAAALDALGLGSRAAEVPVVQVASASTSP